MMTKVGDIVWVYDRNTGYKVRGIVADINSGWYKIKTDRETMWISNVSLELIEKSVLPNGITVKQLIGELKKYNPEDKVYMYNSEGDLYNIVRVMKDKSKLVVF